MADIMKNIMLSVTYRAVNPATGCRGGVEIPTQLTFAADAPVSPLVVDFQHTPGCRCLCGGETTLSSPKLKYIHDHVEEICQIPGREYDEEMLVVVFLKLALGLPVPAGFELGGRF